MKPIQQRGLAIFFAGSLIMAACAGEEEQFGENLAAEPTSLSELSTIGGATFEKRTPEQLATSSEVMIEGVVTNIRKSRLNTRDGNFPSADQIGVDGVPTLDILTDVEIAVDAILHADIGQKSPQARETFIVTVIGGTIITDLDAKQAAALGVMEVIGEGDGEIERPVDGPVREFWWGRGTETEMDEGDVVTLMLEQVDIPGFKGGPAERITTLSHPDGVLVQHADGTWRLSNDERVVVDRDHLIDLANSGS